MQVELQNNLHSGINYCCGALQKADWQRQQGTHAACSLSGAAGRLCSSVAAQQRGDLIFISNTKTGSFIPWESTGFVAIVKSLLFDLLAGSASPWAGFFFAGMHQSSLNW